MNKPFDPTKPVQTRDGKPARIVSTKLGKVFSIGAIVTYPDDVEAFITCTCKGNYSTSELNHSLDLINIPEKRTVWLNIYNSEYAMHYVTKEEADILAFPGRIACIKLEYVEGEGL